MTATRLVLFLVYFYGVNANGEFVAIHVPSSLEFGVSSIPIKESFLKYVFYAALGIPQIPEEESEWSNKIHYEDPFNLPEAVVTFIVKGVPSIGSFGDDIYLYPLIEDSYEPAAGIAMEEILKKSCPNCTVVIMDLSNENNLHKYKHVFGDFISNSLPVVQTKYLKSSEHDDNRFLQELQTLKVVTFATKSGVFKPDTFRDYFEFTFSSLQGLWNQDSLDVANKISEAKHLLNEEIRALKQAFLTLYDDRVLFTVVTKTGVNSRLGRRKRGMGLMDSDFFKKVEKVPGPPSLGSPGKSPDKSPGSPNTGGIDPAIIHIVFWLCMVLYFSMLAVVYVMMAMDPGRDSIVYRMTSSIDRIKME